MSEIDPLRAITVLKNLRRRLVALQETARKRRSWRPSEKAMAIAGYAEEIRALDLAIQEVSNGKSPPS